MFQFRAFIIYFFVSVIIFTLAPFTVANAIGASRIKIVDQHQKPLANAIVELYFNNSREPDTNHTKTESVYIMDQINKSFVPSVLIVPKGSLVSFPNSDDLRHHVYSFSAAKTFELKLYAGKPKSPLQFSDEGIVVLGCNIHDAMVGYIYVSENKNNYKTDNNGIITIDQTLNSIERLQVWHPNATEGAYHRQSYTYAQLKPLDNVVTISINVNEPEARDSFEDQFSHAH
ncbi:methylamine utilization protein [Thalassotalea profundi]|nr:methylamine utilization protein [Thalassotalea profundi]